MRLPAENIKAAREVQLVDFLNTYRPGELTMADHRTNMTRDMIKAIHTSYGPHTRIYQAIVPRCTRVGESLTKSESVLRYSKQCPASTAYRALAKEVEKGERSREKHPTALDR